jgi:4-aminobutyrate aminotransferase-like enzyme
VSDFEELRTEVPGPRSRELAATLRRYESQNVTYVSRDLPIFWSSAQGATVTDVDGNTYIDFTSAFGVAAVGHGNEAVANAIAAQAKTLGHGMGDVHPTDVRTRLLSRLAAIAPVENPKIFLCSTGAEAVEFAMKTAALATGDFDLLAFGGAYHGLSYGTLEICGIPKFRRPFEPQLRQNVLFAAYPRMNDRQPLDRVLTDIRKTLRRHRSIGGVIVEPIQGRAGYIVPPEGFLRGLREICTEADALLILDEIYTGFGRSGVMFACEEEGVRPDLLCIGKALGGGFPIAAVIGRGDVMDAWPESEGEALHTSTFLGNPMGCAAALAVLDEFNKRSLVARARRIGTIVADRLNKLGSLSISTRGRGAMWAVEFASGETAAAVSLRALRRGLIVLQAGIGGNVITISPPLITTDEQLDRGLALLAQSVREVLLPA